VQNSILLVFALESESQGRPEKLGYNTLYTGVGKLNASIALLNYLHNNDRKQAIDWVINLGSAGSQTLPTGSLVFGDDIKQHDMNAEPLGFEPGITPFDTGPQSFQSKHSTILRDNATPGLVLTGDRFVTEKLPWKADAIDMEAFALAKVCYTSGIAFSTLKYITDGANDQSASDWTTEVNKAARVFESILSQLQK